MLLSRRLGTALWTGAVAAGLAACGGQPVTATSEFTVQQFFSSVHAVVLPGGGSAPLAPVREPGKPQAQLTAVEPVEVQAVLHTGAHPAPGSGPAGTLVLESSIITGLPAKLRYTSTQPFTSLSLAVGGANDYWEITLPAPATSVQVIATVATGLPGLYFGMEGLVADTRGWGGLVTQTINAVDLADADVAMVLRWNAPSDVDIHVYDGKGQHVFYANKTTPEGGRLDLDSNPACNIDGINQEVVSWPRGTAPLGNYRVEVDYYADCGVPRSDYSVTVSIRGRQANSYTGSFIGPRASHPRDTVATFSLP